MTWEIVEADCTKWLPEAAALGLRVDCVIVNPTISPQLHREATRQAGLARAQHGRDGAATRLSRGFMGSSTDAGDIAFRPETWKAVLAVMVPGARMACFVGTRSGGKWR